MMKTTKNWLLVFKMYNVDNKDNLLVLKHWDCCYLSACDMKVL